MSRSLNGDTVCVVGGAGFLGSHMVCHLTKDRGCKVLVVDNLCVGRREWLPPETLFFHHDITTSESYLKLLFEKHDVSWVFNYAAHPYVPDSFDRPSHVVMTNFVGAVNVINAAHEAGVAGILQVGSAELYGEGQRGMVILPGEEGHSKGSSSIDEDGKVQPHSTYGVSKAAVDFYCQARWREARVPVIVLRQFNCVGERETHPYVIPEIISQLHRARQKNGGITVRLGNNTARDFLYAGDAVVMASELLEKGRFGEVYNLGSETSIKVYDLAQLVASVMNCGKVYVEEDPERKRPWDIWHLKSDNRRAYEVISRRPTTTLEQAVVRTIRWFNDNGCRWPWEAR